MIVDGDDCVFRVLGPVQVLRAGRPVAFARRQQVDLLAFLLLHLDRVVTVGQIVDAMWGDAVPRTASTQIKNMLSALRGALADGGPPLATVDRQPAGYRLRIAAGQFDLARFHALVAQARATADAAPVAGLLRDALDLWQGPTALAGVRANFVDAARVHLGEVRDTAREALFDAELDCGNHTKIVAELTDVVADNPGRERFVAQLMVALYRGGRATEALQAYRRARQILADEYGLEPGPALRDLERLVLVGDTALEQPQRRPETRVDAGVPSTAAVATGQAPTPGRSVRANALPVPAQLPLDVRGFAGRGTELAWLNALVTEMAEKPAAVVIAALMGTPGVGKTALAVHWAHRITDRFPDGQLYVNLRGFDPNGPAMSPGEAVRGFLDAFGVPPERVPAGVDAQAALFRSQLAGRRVLVLLDNALDAEQVRPLLPGTPGCLVIVTSRNQLTSLVAAEGAYPVTLDVLTELEARELLVGRLGPERVQAEAPAVADLVEQCARLPLALSMVAARAAIHRGLSLAALSTELAEARGGLDGLGASATEDMRVVFSWSYRRLRPPAARLFRLVGLPPGPHLALAAAASLLGAPVTTVRPLLAELTRAHLVTEPTSGRYAVHDLLRAYARELAYAVDSEGDRRAAVRRLLDHYLHSAAEAALLLYPHRYQVRLVPAERDVTRAELADHASAVAWFTAEHPVLVAAVSQAAEAGFGTHTWQLASTLGMYLDRRGHWRDWVATQHVAVAAAQRVADRDGEAHAHGGLGLAFIRLGEYEAAHDHLRRAYELFQELGDPIAQAYTHLRMSSMHEGQRRYEDALDHAQRALALYREAEHRAGQAQALNFVGWYHAMLGAYESSIVHCEQAVALHRELGDRHGEAHTLDSLGYAHHLLGRHAAAGPYFEQAVEMLNAIGDHFYEAMALTHLGDARRAAGDADGAREAWRRALLIVGALGHPFAEQIEDKLRELPAA